MSVPKEAEDMAESKRIKLERDALPGPSCLSMKSEWSLDHPHNFKGVFPLDKSLCAVLEPRGYDITTEVQKQETTAGSNFEGSESEISKPVKREVKYEDIDEENPERKMFNKLQEEIILLKQKNSELEEMNSELKKNNTKISVMEMNNTLEMTILEIENGVIKEENFELKKGITALMKEITKIRLISRGKRAIAEMSDSSEAGNQGSVPLVTPPSAADMTKSWHDDITQDLRNDLVTKFVQGIFPCTDPAALLDPRMKNLMDYARMVEGGYYQSANSTYEYHQLIAEKLFKIQKELELKQCIRLQRKQDVLRMETA